MKKNWQVKNKNERQDVRQAISMPHSIAIFNISLKQNNNSPINTFCFCYSPKSESGESSF